MAIFKCKMCGGALDISPDSTVVECEFCGIKQTIPRLDDEKRANYYDRADHYRRSNDYDKALSIYEQILAEDNTDAEAYWSIVLCRYGVEYVKDPVTQKHVPTINRTQAASILADPDYLSALKYADGYQRDVYTEQANAIHEIQKGILAISQQEDPFDVFICYKESDQSGRRTPDSVLAQELYYELTEMGYRVFFSRITLEDKLGSAYEPYIFAALQSARVMVVLGTKAEYFEAVWVRNEWSRFLALIQSGENKVLIPAYRDMDPYDLPREFSHLQAQNMSKLGFMQDLVRGIGKLAPKVKDYFAPEHPPVQEPVMGAPMMVPNYLKRISMFVADGAFDEAREYCDKVLDLDPENADAYLYSLLAAPDVQCRDAKELAFLDFDYTQKHEYQRAYRFGNAKRKAELDAYTKPVLERLQESMALSDIKKQVDGMLQQHRKELQELIHEKNTALENDRRALLTAKLSQHQIDLPTQHFKDPRSAAITNLVSAGVGLLAVILIAVGVYALGVLMLFGSIACVLLSYLTLSRHYWPQYDLTARIVIGLLTWNIPGLIFAISTLQGKKPKHRLGDPTSTFTPSNGAAQRKAELEQRTAALEAEISALREAFAQLPATLNNLSVEEIKDLELVLQARIEKCRYHVVLLSCQYPYAMTREMSRLLNLAPANASEQIRQLPAYVAKNLSKAQALEIQRALSSHGRMTLRLASIE